MISHTYDIKIILPRPVAPTAVFPFPRSEEKLEGETVIRPGEIVTGEFISAMS